MNVARRSNGKSLMVEIYCKQAPVEGATCNIKTASNEHGICSVPKHSVGGGLQIRGNHPPRKLEISVLPHSLACADPAILPSRAYLASSILRR
jgi:hypothetical protein